MKLIHLKRIARKLPFFENLDAVKVKYTQAELARLENEVAAMQAAYDQLCTLSPDVLDECRKNNPSVTSEIHIKDLVKFKASRLMQDIRVRKEMLNEARKYVE